VFVQLKWEMLVRAPREVRDATELLGVHLLPRVAEQVQRGVAGLELVGEVLFVQRLPRKGKKRKRVSSRSVCCPEPGLVNIIYSARFLFFFVTWREMRMVGERPPGSVPFAPMHLSSSSAGTFASASPAQHVPLSV
jgi:hypothetical protein